MIDKFNVEFADFLLSVFIGNDKGMLLIFILSGTLILQIVIVAAFDKTNTKSHERAISIETIVLYDFFVFIVSVLFIWYVAAIVSICAMFFVRCIQKDLLNNNEKEFIKDENTTLIKFKTVFINFIIVFLTANSLNLFLQTADDSIFSYWIK